MKKAILLMLSALLFTGCANTAIPNTPDVETLAYTQAKYTPVPTPTQKSVEGIAKLKGISEYEIAYIDCLDHTKPDASARVWASQEEIHAALTVLQSIRVTGKIPEDVRFIQAPAAQNSVVLHLLDGSSITIGYDTAYLQVDGVYYTYEGSFDVATSPYAMQVRRETTQDGGALHISFINNQKDTASILLIPNLERLSTVDKKWESIRADVGFCGTPDPLPTGTLEHVVPLSIYPASEKGTYRVSFKVTREEQEVVLAGVFTME